LRLPALVVLAVAILLATSACGSGVSPGAAVLVVKNGYVVDQHALGVTVDFGRSTDDPVVNPPVRPERIVLVAPRGYVFRRRVAGDLGGWNAFDRAGHNIADPEYSDADRNGMFGYVDPSDPGVQACAAGHHAVAWLMRIVHDQQWYDVPAVVDQPASGRARLTICFDVLHRAYLDPGSIRLYIWPRAFHAPSPPTLDRWQATVTPFAPDGQADAVDAFDLRADDPRHQQIQLVASYDVATRLVTVQGRLLTLGRPTPHATVEIDGASATQTGEAFTIGTVTTDAHGRFTYTGTQERPSKVWAWALMSVHACTEHSGRRCVSETTSDGDPSVGRVTVLHCPPRARCRRSVQYPATGTVELSP
jgi:hypothetical protein